MKKTIIILILTSILIFPFSSLAETLVFGVLEDLPPFQYKENGQWKGIDIEIGKELSKRLNVEFKYEGLPWVRIKKYATEGKIDGVLSMFCLEKYLDIIDFAESPVKSEICVIALKERDTKVNSLSDLKNLMVGVIRGYTYAQEFDSYKDIRKIECNNDKELLKRLNDKRIDVAVAESIPFRYLNRKQDANSKLKELFTIKENKLCMGFSKKALGVESRTWADKIHKAFIELNEEGIIQNILNNYMN